MSPLGTTRTFSPERFYVRTPPVVPQTNNANGVGWRTGRYPPVEAKRLSSGLANSQETPAEKDARAGDTGAVVNLVRVLTRFTARMYAPRAIRARALGCDVMNAPAQIADRIGPLIDKEDENTGAPWPRGARVARTVA